MVLPLFKSHYSIGKSILTLEKKEASIEGGPASIIDLCLKNKISEMYLVDDSMSGFLEGYLNSKAAELSFRFGLRLSICDTKDKNEESLQKTSKCIIFAKNKKGYQDLIKIYSLASQDGFYYEPRIDFESLKNLWGENDLALVVPFYDSFLHLNALHGALCIPDFEFCKPVFLIEKNDIPFNVILERHVKNFCKDKYEMIQAKSIYYDKKTDFKAYLTFRCVNERTNLNKPNFSHMTSEEFSLQSWEEQLNG